MTSKEKVHKALEHQSGPVPMDFGTNAVTGMHCSIVEGLREYYGLEKHPVKINEPYQMLGEIEPDLQDAMGVDVDAIYPPKTMFGFPNEGWKEWTTPWGQDVLVPEKFNVTVNENGDTLIYPEGDTSAPPSGKMPETGMFFDAIMRQEPIDDDNLNVEDNLEEFGPISGEDVEHYRREAERMKDSSRAVMAMLGGLGLGDIALVPAPMMKHPKGIRDVTEWYISTLTRRDYLHQIFDYQTKVGIENLEKIHNVVGELFDAVMICGTDFGTQDSTFCSTDTYRELYMPYYQRINSWIHENTSWKTFKHSCGAVIDFMPLFIESGFDIINPVQLSAKGMDRETLKSNFGEDLVFWGGGVDTQKTMPFGTAEEVRADVLKSCEVFSRGGGYVFNAVHNVQAKSPIENVVAMIDAVHEFNGEKLFQ